MQKDHWPGLTGLRAVAVIAVIADHSGVPLCSGGFLGVDVFFVLSGFLITGILLRENDRGRIGIGRFYLRRALRLYPALIAATLLFLLVTDAGWWPTEDRGTNAAAALTYLTDFSVVFGWTDLQHNLMLHTWSLSVEEHFYLVWPLLLLLVLRRGTRRQVFVTSVALMLIAFVILQLGFDTHTRTGDALIYYRPDARAAAILLGCALATAPLSRQPAWLGYLGAVTIPFAMLAARGGSNERLAYLLMPLVWLATAVVILHVVVPRPDSLSRLLSAKPMVYVGLISYGMYLYHPITNRIVDGLVPGLRHALYVPLYLVAAFVAASLSYYAVERPALRLKERVGRPHAVRAP